MSKITIRIECDFRDGELKAITDGLWSKAEESLLRILRRYDRGEGVTKRTISQRMSHNTNSEERTEIIKQLIQEGIIEIVNHAAAGEFGARYRVRPKKKL